MKTSYRPRIPFAPARRKYPGDGAYFRAVEGLVAMVAGFAVVITSFLALLNLLFSPGAAIYSMGFFFIAGVVFTIYGWRRLTINNKGYLAEKKLATSFSRWSEPGQEL